MAVTSLQIVVAAAGLVLSVALLWSGWKGLVGSVVSMRRILRRRALAEALRAQLARMGVQAGEPFMVRSVAGGILGGEATREARRALEDDLVLAMAHLETFVRPFSTPCGFHENGAVVDRMTVLPGLYVLTPQGVAWARGGS